MKVVTETGNFTSRCHLDTKHGISARETLEGELCTLDPLRQCQRSLPTRSEAGTYDVAQLLDIDVDRVNLFPCQDTRCHVYEINPKRLRHERETATGPNCNTKHISKTKNWKNIISIPLHSMTKMLSLRSTMN